MNILVVNNHTIRLHDIHKLFLPTDTLSYISYNQIGGYELDDVDCIVLTGSSKHPYTSPVFSQELDIIRLGNKPLIGICLGCELIADSFGAIIAKDDERIEGDIMIMCEDKTYTVHEAHRYALISLGEELDGYARSDYGYEIIRHRTKPILGFQFHPEVMEPYRDGYDLFGKYIKDILS